MPGSDKHLCFLAQCEFHKRRIKKSSMCTMLSISIENNRTLIRDVYDAYFGVESARIAHQTKPQKSCVNIA